MAAKEARDQPDRRERQAHAAISDNELKAAAYFAVDVASEGSVRGRNVAYEISFAGYIHQEGDTSRRAPIEAGSFRAG